MGQIFFPTDFEEGIRHRSGATLSLDLACLRPCNQIGSGESCLALSKTKVAVKTKAVLKQNNTFGQNLVEHETK